jgi:hypothetical protein
LPVVAPPLLNRFVTEPAIPVRRRIEQPSAEKAKRSGCLMWGAVLGVLVGIMVGVYALPPILKHYYGEKTVEPGETYGESAGTRITLASIGQASEPLGEASPGMRRFDYFGSVTATFSNNRELKADDFSLELNEVGKWQRAVSLDDEPTLYIPEFTETIFAIHFIVEVPEGDAGKLTPHALHLSDPRVKFEIAP